MDKKFKAQEKRAKREERKNSPTPVYQEPMDADEDSEDNIDPDESAVP